MMCVMFKYQPKMGPGVCACVYVCAYVCACILKIPVTASVQSECTELYNQIRVGLISTNVQAQWVESGSNWRVCVSSVATWFTE